MSKTSQLRQRAQDYLKKGKLDKAIEEYKRLLSVESRNPNLYNELGDIFLRYGDRIQAVSSFEKAAANYEKVALYNNAIAVCKKILRVVPDRTDTIFKLGEIRAKQKFEGEAVSYFTMCLSNMIDNPQIPAEEIKQKLDRVLELVSDNEEILSKAADVYSRIGMHLKSVEILTELVSRSRASGNDKGLNFYQSRIDRLKPALSPDELKKVSELIPREAAARDDEGAAAGSVVKEAIEESEIIAAMDPGESQTPTGDVGPAFEETGGSRQPAAVGDEGAPKDQVSPGPAEQTKHGGSGEDFTASAEDGGENAGSEELAGEAAGESDAKNLVKEITSDIKEGDFKSHYDLGMAYLEMALYSEAIKEFQIASRYEQLQLRSIEMIGHCFLLQNNPRLAVKQLLRGLKLAEDAGNSDCLGIHYNLGLAYEMLGDMDKAREHFEEVYIVDVTFRDTEKKMEKLKTIP